MTASRETLKAAVLKVLPIDPERGDTLIRYDVPEVLWQKFTPAPVYGDPNVLADAIVDAVIAADGQEGSVEWSYRHPGGLMSQLPPLWGASEQFIRDLAAKHGLTVIRRRVTEWEAVPE